MMNIVINIMKIYNYVLINDLKVLHNDINYLISNIKGIIKKIYVFVIIKTLKLIMQLKQ